jgi:glycosyltransferase involved in cell wall biosynthesis
VNVVFCQPTLNRSGSEKSLLQMLRGLEQRGTCSSIHVLAGQDGVMRGALHQYAQVTVLNAPKLKRTWRGIGSFLRSFFTLYRALRLHADRGGAVVYVNTLMFPQAIIGAFLNRLPVIVHIREVASTYPPGVYRVYSFIAGICASTLVAPCNYVFSQRQIPRFALRSKRHKVIHNAASGYGSFVRRTLTQPYRILVVIPCTVRKGVFDLVECVKDLKDHLGNHGASFHVDVVGAIGQGTTFEEVSRQIARNRTEAYITFHGEVDNVDEFFLRAHVLLHPSHSECFPRVLVEAFGFSLPCVATDVGGVSELVKPEENGYLVPVGASSQMAAALTELLTQPARYTHYATNAFDSFQRKLSIAQLGQSSAQLLEAVGHDYCGK